MTIDTSYWKERCLLAERALELQEMRTTGAYDLVRLAEQSAKQAVEQRAETERRVQELTKLESNKYATLAKIARTLAKNILERNDVAEAEPEELLAETMQEFLKIRALAYQVIPDDQAREERDAVFSRLSQLAEHYGYKEQSPIEQIVGLAGRLEVLTRNEQIQRAAVEKLDALQSVVDRALNDQCLSSEGNLLAKVNLFIQGYGNFQAAIVRARSTALEGAHVWAVDDETGEFDVAATVGDLVNRANQLRELKEVLAGAGEVEVRVDSDDIVEYARAIAKRSRLLAEAWDAAGTYQRPEDKELSTVVQRLHGIAETQREIGELFASHGYRLDKGVRPLVSRVFQELQAARSQVEGFERLRKALTEQRGTHRLDALLRASVFAHAGELLELKRPPEPNESYVNCYVWKRTTNIVSLDRKQTVKPIGFAQYEDGREHIIRFVLPIESSHLGPQLAPVPEHLIESLASQKLVDEEG